MFYMAFLLGLAGSAHCLGMCGPIALAIGQPGRSAWRGRLQYQGGRLLAYVGIGAVAGLLGQALFLSDLQAYLAYGTGALMIAAGLLAANLDAWLHRVPGMRRWYDWVGGWLGKALQRRGGAWLVGFLNGLLPCGMVYMALFGALSMGNVLHGMAYMASFGAGTLPAMLGAGMAAQWMQHRWKPFLRKAFPVLLVALGLLLVFRGTHLHAAQGRETSAGAICQ
jgi:hypothetical protein